MAAALASAAAGCAAERPPPASDGNVEAPPPVATGGFANVETKPPGCGQLENGGLCDCIDVPMFTDPPNIYFVLDRSGSMAESGKWDRVRLTVARLMRGLGPRANFGATIFPYGATPSAVECGTGAEVMSMRAGDPPSSQAYGPTARFLIDATHVAPMGGTPTAATLAAVHTRVAALSGKSFVVLATDGGPNCNAGTTCGIDRCMPNIESFPGCTPTGPANCCEPPEYSVKSCLDATASINAVAGLRNSGIPVFVIGIPGSAAYSTLLDQLATVGGTALPTTPRYFRVDTANEEAILAALRKVAAKIVATCEFKLREPPKDPNLVNVYFDDVVVPRTDESSWTLEGDTVRLVGEACRRVMDGEVLDVRVIAGCPTVAPR